MQTIGSFQLINNGGFVCAGKVMFIDTDNGTNGTTDRWDWITNPNSETMYPKDKDIKQNWFIQMYIDIMAGSDRTGGQFFLYDPNSKACAIYRITGTTLNSSVHFEGVTG